MVIFILPISIVLLIYSNRFTMKPAIYLRTTRPRLLIFANNEPSAVFALEYLIVK